MFKAFFITFVFLHLTFGLALSFFIMYFSVKSEGWLKTFGYLTGWFLIVLSILVGILTPLFFIKVNDLPCPYFMYKKMQMRDQSIPMMEQGKIEEEKTEKTGGACPIE